MTRPSRFSQENLPDFMAAIVVSLAPLVYFFPATRGRLTISPDDGVIFNVPLRAAAANLMRAGYLPLWDPYIFSGMPLHGAAQAGLLFPLNWFYLVASPPVATNLMMLATYALAALGAYLYAREAGANIMGAIATSLSWQFSAFMVEHVGHTNILHTAAMLPWVLWAIDRYARTGERRGGLLLAGIVALQIFAGHQQTSAYSLLLACAYTVVMAQASKTARSRYRWSLALLFAGFALAAVQILPTVELLRNSLRVKASYDFFSSFSMPPRFALTFFVPFLFGGGNGLLFRAPYIGQSFFGEYVGYVGVLTIMLALIAVFLKLDVRTKFWAVIAVIGLLLAFGRFLPLQIYGVIYYVPILNLFRVPARHLMEVEFALAVLGGRGLTVLASRPRDGKTSRRVALACGIVFLLTGLAVTWWRPAAFRLGREAPVSFLRAPELFVPILMIVLSAWALWCFARSKRRLAIVWPIVVLVLDLFVYGQSSGWRTNSPTRNSELWSEPATVKFLRDRESQGEGSYRILTQDRSFDPDLSLPPSPASDWILSLQPDIYMMHGIENAAGYDGFGLARYSRLAGDMKVWGELSDAERTLRGESRELDLLNVRYLLTRPIAGATSISSRESSSITPSSSPSLDSSLTSAISPTDFPTDTQDFGGQRFAIEDLGLPSVGADARLVFLISRVEANRIALMTSLSWSVEMPDGAVVARLRLRAEGGKIYDFDLRAGEHSSEWAHDREDIHAKIKHRRAPVATSYPVEDAQGRYEAHTYTSSFTLPEKEVIMGADITVVRQARAPDLALSVLRVSLIDEPAGKVFPLRREWVRKELLTSSQPKTSATVATSGPSAASTSQRTQRWRPLANFGNVTVFENTRALPRAWLAAETQVLAEPQMLEAIRTGKLPNGEPWDPRRTALLEAPLDFNAQSIDDSASAEVISHEPNGIKLRTKSAAASMLVLSENHYPGWRAYVDGRATETVRVNFNLRGVVLPPGSHLIEFFYWPKSVLSGLVLSLLTLAALLLWVFRTLPEVALRRAFLRFVRPNRDGQSPVVGDNV